MYEHWIAASRLRAGLVITLVSLSMPVAAIAAEADSAPAPAASPEKSAKKAIEFTLENGLDVVVIPDHRAPIVTQMVWYKAGGADEHPAYRASPTSSNI